MVNLKGVLGSTRHRTARLFRRLRVDRRGAVGVLLAVSIIPLIGFIGIGTDVARAYLVKSRLSSALDAAALAGGWSFYLSTRDDDIKMFFKANFPTGYMDASLAGPDIKVDAVNETVFLSATATIGTTFMRLFGHNTMTVYAESEVTRKMQALDVAIAIDMSGSMASYMDGSTRIAAARNAALTLVDILFGADTTKEYLHIGLVPWSAKVNVTLNGTSFDSSQTTTQTVPTFTNPETGVQQSVLYYANNSPVPLLEAPPSNWKGCVFTRFQKPTDDGNDADILLDPVSVGGKDWLGWQPIGPEGEPVSGWGICSMAVYGSECTRCLDHGVTPLTNTKATITNALNSLTNPTSNTNIPEGLGWAWRVLKPDAPFTEAVPNPDYDRQQAIVLLTDGENVPGSGDGYKGTWGLGSTAQQEMNKRLLKLADNIKASGVTVYVIQFANDGTSLQTLLQTVASGPEAPFYYYAPDSETLKQAFREVANHLSELRLSK